MNRLRTGVMAAAAALIALTGFAGQAAAATKGFVPHNVQLRAGPGRDYPVVAGVSAGRTMSIYGCISGWGWCDVNYRGYRGWISGRDLVVPHHRHNVKVIDVGSRIGLSVVLFDRDDYWDRHYSKKTFYRDYYRHHSHRRHDNDRRGHDSGRHDGDRGHDHDGGRRADYRGHWND